MFIEILAAQIAFDLVVAVNGFANLQHFGIRELIDATLQRNADLLDDFLGELVADAVNVGERDDNALVRRDVNASYAGHVLLHVGRDRSDLAGGLSLTRVRWRPALAG
jgi:hypothetical protein